MTARPSYLYRLHGLCVASELELPFPPSPDACPPDVRVRRRRLPGSLARASTRTPVFEAGPGRYLLKLPGVGRFRVLDGSLVEVDPDPAASPVTLGFHASSAPWAAVLHQRGVPALHASAVEVGSGAVALAGDSASGKSVTAAAFALAGHRVVSDEATALALTDGRPPLVLPGSRTLYLWGDSCEALGIDPAAARESGDGLPRYRWLPETDPAPAPLELRAVIVLRAVGTGPLETRELRGPGKLAALLDQTLRPAVLSGVCPGGADLVRLGAVARAVPVFELRRPFAGAPATAVRDAVLRVLAG